MIEDILGEMGSKKQDSSYCYNCGHQLLMHAYYSLLDGHVVVDYENLEIKYIWMGVPVIFQVPMPIVKKSVCPCKRFVSKYDYEREMENDG